MINIQEKDKGFVLNFKQRVVFEHSESLPMVHFGTGVANYHLSYGNFTINDDLNEKLGLCEFEIDENSDQKAVISFKRGNIFSVQMVFSVENGRLLINFRNPTAEVNRLWIRLKGSSKEHIYGCGEQFSELDLKGSRVPLWVSESGVGRNKKSYITFQADLADDSGGDTFTTYYPQPSFISSDNYLCHVDGSAYMEFDFRKKDYSELMIWEIPEKIYFDVEDDSVSLLRNLTDLLGRQPELPDWSYDGLWLGLQGGTEAMLEKKDKALEKGIKIASLWAQDWEGKRITAFGKQLMWDWIYHKEMYKDLPGTIKNLNEKGVKVLGYINPFLALEGELYKEASEKGYLVKNVHGKEYYVIITTFPAAIVDLTNPDAFEWIKGVIKENMIGIGLSGWMADFGEYLPTDAVLHSGESAEFYHNKYPSEWARANREAIEEAGKLGEVVFFTRAGYTGTTRYSTMMWHGDQFVDWSLDDSIASVVPAALSLGLSGFGLSHSDLGGYTSLFGITRSKELFMRWAEFSAFTPVMRSHEGNRPDENWQFDSDEETMMHLAKMTDVHVHLKPYFIKTVKENAESGIPVMRHPYIHYENDDKLHQLKYQYLLGRDLMVAPVLEKEKTVASVYLPDDEWIDIWSGKEYGKGEHNIHAPLGRIPVFYRKRSEFSDLFARVINVALKHTI